MTSLATREPVVSRHREIAASPARSAGQAWSAIGDLVATTLDRSTSIDRHDVDGVFVALMPAGRALVSGGHLDRDAITVVAGSLHLTINCISGERALTLIDEENLNQVPGAATATDWTIYLPRPGGLGLLIDDVVKGVSHVSTDAAPPEDTPLRADAGKVVSSIDFSRLDPGRR